MNWLVCTMDYGVWGEYATKRDAYDALPLCCNPSVRKIWSGYYEVNSSVFEGTGSTFYVGKIDRLRHDGWEV